VVWSPLAMGVLTGKYDSRHTPPHGSRAAGPAGEMMGDYFTQEVLDAVARCKGLAREAGCSMAQLALAWVLRVPDISSAIVGATSPEHVDENVRAADLRLDPAIFARMDEILGPVGGYEAYHA
jgi:aryl-alcohol dehydrogenase-like predicted oxidoreductase